MDDDNQSAAEAAPPAAQHAGAAPSAAWYETLPEDLKTNPHVTKFKDPENLARGYVNAVSLIGADKIAIPTQQSGKEYWEEVYGKLGRPETPDAYELPVPENANQELVGGYKQAAHAAGLNSQQAAGLLSWYAEMEQTAAKAAQVEAAAAVERAEKELRVEFGRAFDAKVGAADQLLQEFGDDSLREHLKATGLNNDPRLIRMLAKMADTMKEDQVAQGTTNGVMTPAEANSRIAAIKSDPKGPYWDAKHIDHARQVEEVNRLFRYAFPDAA